MHPNALHRFGGKGVFRRYPLALLHVLWAPQGGRDSAAMANQVTYELAESALSWIRGARAMLGKSRPI